MRGHPLLVLLLLAILLPLGCFFFMIWQPLPKPHKYYNIETEIRWSKGPDIVLNAENMAKLNREVADLIQKEAPGSQAQYSLVALGPRRVEVLYLSDEKLAISTSLQEELNAFIRRRIVELAWEQGQAIGK
ncbi:MAG: hypothetical protein LV479_12695 [Methylacidiphilales bacterium]|nr:hypothetical protein [Candidatus Methylacidiphilales bacterium]